MARKKAGIKYVRVSAKNRTRNISVKTAVKKAIKAAIASIDKKEKEAKDKVKSAVSVIDKAVENGILHKNTGARKKSRLILRFNKAHKK